MSLVLLFLLLLFCSAWSSDDAYATRARTQGTFNNENRWSLEPVEAETIQSISDLTDGVYSVELVGGRSQCLRNRKGANSIFAYIQLLGSFISYHHRGKCAL